MYHLRREHFIPLPLEQVFPFFCDARNLRTITPAWMRFRIVSIEEPLREGALIRYVLHFGPIPVGWTTRITWWDPPHGFGDEQLKGPYKSWLHTHRFQEHDGGTLMIDTVDYALPFGLLGRMMHWAVKLSLNQIFDYRAETITRLMCTPPGSSSTR